MAERRRSPAPLPELLPDHDYRAFRRVKRDEGAGDAPICPDCQSPLQPNPYNHLPSCTVRVRDGRPWRPHESADAAVALLAEAPVALPQSTELAAKPTDLPAQSTELAIVPEVMPPAAPAGQAGTIEVAIKAPPGTNLRINISMG